MTQGVIEDCIYIELKDGAEEEAACNNSLIKIFKEKAVTIKIVGIP